MNDFEAPQLSDTTAPRIFNTITSKQVSYDMDFVQYLMGVEADRRATQGEPRLSAQEAAEFLSAIVSLVIIQGNPEAGIKYRLPVQHKSNTKQQLNG
jgi:hypothetical protein